MNVYNPRRHLEFRFALLSLLFESMLRHDHDVITICSTILAIDLAHRTGSDSGPWCLRGRPLAEHFVEGS